MRSLGDMFELGKKFTAVLDERLLDMATDRQTGWFITLEDLGKWKLAPDGSVGYSLGHMWCEMVRGCVAASWQDACGALGLPHYDAELLEFRKSLLISWGVDAEKAA